RARAAVRRPRGRSSAPLARGRPLADDPARCRDGRGARGAPLRPPAPAAGSAPCPSRGRGDRAPGARELPPPPLPHGRAPADDESPSAPRGGGVALHVIALARG